MFANLPSYHWLCDSTNKESLVKSCTERSGLSGLADSCDDYPAGNKTSLVFSANMSLFFLTSSETKEVMTYNGNVSLSPGDAKG